MSETNSAAPQAANTPAPASPETESQVIEETSAEEVEAEGGESAEAQAADAAAIVADPNASKAEKAEAKKLIKKLKLKVDGREIDEELPFEIPDTEEARSYMAKNLQMSKAANKRMQEAAQQQNDFKLFVEMLKENPEEILSNPMINVDLKKFATKIMEQAIEDEKKSPEQLKAEKLEKELKALKEEREKEKEEAKKRDEERIRMEAVERYDMLIDQAFKKYPDVPQTPHVISRVSDYMVLGFQNGMDLSPEDVLPLVQKELEDELVHRLKNSSDEYVEKIVGKDRLNAFRKKATAAAKAKVAPKVVDTGSSSSKKEEAPAKKITIKDMFKV